jgi:hypothetical protein
MTSLGILAKSPEQFARTPVAGRLAKALERIRTDPTQALLGKMIAEALENVCPAVIVTPSPQVAAFTAACTVVKLQPEEQTVISVPVIVGTLGFNNVVGSVAF